MLIDRVGEVVARAARNREARVVVAFSAANLVLGLGSNRLLTEVVPPAELGELYLFTNLALWLTLPASTSYLYVVRHWQVARNDGQLHRFWGGMKVGLAIQAVLAGVGALAMWGTGIVPLGLHGTLLLALSAAATGAAQVLEPFPSGERRRVTSGFLGLAGTPLRQASLGLAAAWLGPVSLGTLVLVHSLHAAVLAGFALLLAVTIVHHVKQERGARREVTNELTLSGYFGYVWPFLVTSGITQLAATRERWGLAALATPAATAVFVQAVGLATAGAGAATSFLNGYFIPIIAQAAGANASPVSAAWRHLRRYLVLTGAVVAAYAGVLWVGAGPLTRLLFGTRYAVVADFLPLTAVGAGLFVLGQAMSMVAFTAKESLTPNGARWIALGGYSALLWLPIRTANPVVYFAWCYVASNALYAVLMGASALWHARLARGAAFKSDVGQPIGG